MSLDPTLAAPEPAARSPWERWVGFWFPAADPTTLGFIRISTGLLVLYIHLAYSVDLQPFFGKNGWYSSAYIERERKEYPWVVSPFWAWDPQASIPAKVPDYPHRRKAFTDFVRALPVEDVKRKQALEFLKRVSVGDGTQPVNPEHPVLALYWVQEMRGLTGRRDRSLAALVEGKVPVQTPTEPTPVPPGFLMALDKDARGRAAADALAFWDVLPTNTAARAYVLNHFTELAPEFRRALVEFLYNLPADPAARDKQIEYLDYWNQQPEKAVRTGNSTFSVWFHVTDPTQMALIHAGVLVAIALFTVGLFTRVMSVVVWVAVVGYIHRTQQVLFGMDTMMNIMLFYLMIGNSGAALSVDRLVARYRAARAGLALGGGTLPANTRAFLAAPPPSQGAGFALRLIQVHFCVIYLAAGFSKLKGNAWWDGRAIWDVMVNPEFTLMQYEWYERGLRAVAGVKPIYHTAAALGVWSTLAIEIAGPFLFWTRLRWLVILLATAMHAVIAVLMGLNLFELLMVIMLLAFMPDQVIRDRLRGGAGLPKVRFGFDPGSADATRAAALAVALDADDQVELVPEAGTGAAAVTDAAGTRHTGAAGAGVLARALRLGPPAALLLRVPGLGRWLAGRLAPAPK